METVHVAEAQTVEDKLPDSRRSHFRPTIQGPCGIMSKVYCANCGADGGLITEDWAEEVFYLCDRCAESVKDTLAVIQVPDAIVRGEAPQPAVLGTLGGPHKPECKCVRCVEDKQRYEESLINLKEQINALS